MPLTQYDELKPGYWQKTVIAFDGRGANNGSMSKEKESG
jgi:hypothetical protein